MRPYFGSWGEEAYVSLYSLQVLLPQFTLRVQDPITLYKIHCIILLSNDNKYTTSLSFLPKNIF